MKLTAEQISEKYKPSQLIAIEVDLDRSGEYATTVVFICPPRSIWYGPFAKAVELNEVAATEQLVKQHCLTHEPVELEAMWEEFPAVYDQAVKGFIAAKNRGVREKKLT